MNAVPVIGGNITQTLFKQNEKNDSSSDSISLAFRIYLVCGINSILVNNMQNLMPAYLEQALFSTWYQGNPWAYYYIYKM